MYTPKFLCPRAAIHISRPHKGERLACFTFHCVTSKLMSIKAFKCLQRQSFLLLAKFKNSTQTVKLMQNMTSPSPN